ncbi:hypothetical protein Pfo_001472 [Paulownia fortunei]|nr:hypothetical protein Pfo_001472 [Paulownia fortunei]
MRFSALRRRAVHAVRKYLRREWDGEALLNFDDVAPFIRRHLKQFYFSLLCASASSAFGSYLSLTGNIGSFFAVFGAFMSIVYFYFTAPWKENKRVCLLVLGAFFGGASIAPWFAWFLNIDPGFVVTSVLASSVGLGCFWAASKWTNRFDRVYYRALLLCSPLILICLLITSAVFGGDSTLWKFQLYAGLLWFMAYVAVYSQEVVLKARRGDGDYVKHAISLFTDFPAVAVHLITLMKLCRRRNR